jgi:hypothetical protein
MAIDPEKKTLPRPYALPGGGFEVRETPICDCPRGRSRGPKGGCCGACGYAIPTVGEALAMGAK